MTTVEERKNKILKELNIDPSQYSKEELKAIIYIGIIADNLRLLNELDLSDIR